MNLCQGSEESRASGGSVSDAGDLAALVDAEDGSVCDGASSAGLGTRKDIYTYTLDI